MHIIFISFKFSILLCTLHTSILYNKHTHVKVLTLLVTSKPLFLLLFSLNFSYLLYTADLYFFFFILLSYHKINNRLDLGWLHCVKILVCSQTHTGRRVADSPTKKMKILSDCPSWISSHFDSDCGSGFGPLRIQL